VCGLAPIGGTDPPSPGSGRGWEVGRSTPERVGVGKPQKRILALNADLCGEGGFRKLEG
jgi:hypothetical protein